MSEGEMLTIRKEQAILQKAVFELQYKVGYRYLDVCGNIINKFLKDAPEWIITGNLPNPQNSSLYSLQNNCILSFSALKLDLALEKPIGEGTISEEEFEIFKNQASSSAAIITNLLGVDEYPRIGFRIWCLFPTKNKEESERWLTRLGAFVFTSDIPKLFGHDIESASATVVVQGENAKYRLSFAGVEQPIQLDIGQGILSIQARSLSSKQDEYLKKRLAAEHRVKQNPNNAVLVDIDCSSEDISYIDPKDFINTSLSEVYSNFAQL
jgi:hypothetical protein